MLFSTVINLVILLSFIYFIGSLILSAFNEAIIGALYRHRHLETSFKEIFFSDDWKTFVEGTLTKSPHIESLMTTKGRFPTYIPARNFILAIIDKIRTEGGNYTKDTLLAAIDKTTLPASFKTILTDLAARAVNNADPIKEFEQSIETFYTNTMDRISGKYKRRIRRSLLFVGFFTATILNIDTIKIVNDGLADTDKLDKAVDNITAQVSHINVNDSVVSITDSSGKIIFSQTPKYDTAYNDNATVKTAKEKTKTLVINYEKTTGFKLGYKSFDDGRKDWFSRGGGHFIIKFIGILLTALALQLGSNYWFDTMNKFVNVRAAGKKPDEPKPETK